MKSEIELRLQGHLLSDWCAQKTAQSEKFLYETGFDSTYRIIRFSILQMREPSISIHSPHTGRDSKRIQPFCTKSCCICTT